MARARSGSDPLEELTAAALQATRTSRRIAFRRAFSRSSPGASCALLADVAALANSGGGVVIIGAERDGSPSGWEPHAFLASGKAELAELFATYTGEPFDGVEVVAATKGGRPVAVLVVHPRVGSPIVFERPGTYRDRDDGEKTVFARGTVYFRHGAKSEPARGRDIARFVAREIDRERRAWQANLRKVAAAPSTARVIVVPPKKGAPPGLADVRVVDDPDAPVVGRTDFDVTHPYRQKDVIRLVNARISGSPINQFDFLCVKRAHAIETQPVFFHKPRFSSPQYSEAFVEWLVAQYAADPTFFQAAKMKYRAAAGA